MRDLAIVLIGAVLLVLYRYVSDDSALHCSMQILKRAYIFVPRLHRQNFLIACESINRYVWLS